MTRLETVVLARSVLRSRLLTRWVVRGAPLEPEFRWRWLARMVSRAGPGTWVEPKRYRIVEDVKGME